jgi:hypothetical protein
MVQQPLGGLGRLIFRGFTITHFRHTTLGRTPLNEWPARRRDLYLTAHNRQTYMPSTGFEPIIPVSERPQTHASDRAAIHSFYRFKIHRPTLSIQFGLYELKCSPLGLQIAQRCFTVSECTQKCDAVLLTLHKLGTSNSTETTSFREGPRSRCYGRTAAMRLIVQPCDEDEYYFLPPFLK